MSTSTAPTIDTPDGTGVRDYIHVSDLAAAHVHALERLIAAPGESLLLNCGYGRGFSVLEVLDSVDRVTNRRIERRLAPRRAGDPPALVADNRGDPRDARPGGPSATISTRSSPTRSPGSASSPSAAEMICLARPPRSKSMPPGRAPERKDAKFVPSLPHCGEPPLLVSSGRP